MSISSTLIDRAAIGFREAAHQLRPYAGCFWVVTAECGATIRLVPDGTTAISLQLLEGRRAEWFLRGPLLRPTEQRFMASTTLVGVRLRPGVASLLSGLAAHSMLDRRIDLTVCAPFHDLVSIDASPRSADRYIDALQDFLIDRLQHASVDPIVVTALREIDREHGGLRVTEVATRCGISPRHLNRLMRLWVGYGPKRYASIVRFQATLAQMEHAPAQAVAFLASETGYFDQAHMTGAVARFAGATPGNLRSRAVSDFSKTRCDDLP